MGKLSVFLKSNKAQRENYKYVASKAFKDEDGNAVEWELRPITTKVHSQITSDCTYDAPIKGKPNMFTPKLDQRKYISKLIAAAVVFPNLNDKELQDSYGVMSAEELICELLDDPAEYMGLYKHINDSNGFDESISDKVDTVKN
jgi:hypothetical protein